MGTAASILDEPIFPLPVQIDVHESTKNLDLSQYRSPSQRVPIISPTSHDAFKRRRRMSMVSDEPDPTDDHFVIQRYIARSKSFKQSAASSKKNKSPPPRAEPVYRFKNLEDENLRERYQGVHFLDFDVLKGKGCFPKYSAEGWRVPGELHQRFLTKSADQIDFENSFVVFVSHCWIHMKGNVTQDTPDNDQYKLCVEAVQYMHDTWAPHMEKCYVWIDYCCTTVQKQSFSVAHLEALTPDQSRKTSQKIEQTVSQESLPPSAPNSTKQAPAHTWDVAALHLDLIMQCCDCMLTPLFDADTSWEPAAGLSDFFEECHAAPWQGTPSSYLSRAWCRMEMLYCACIPLMADLDHHENSRRNRLEDRLLNVQNRGQRPHVLYGSFQQRTKQPPVMISPLPQSRLDKYHPSSGMLSNHADRTIISRLFAEIQPYFDQERVGYVGEVNLTGEMHGQGTYRFENGDTYSGAWKNGLQHGKGVMRFADGGEVEGEFNMGIEFGLCTYKYPNGDKYFGMLCNYQRTGRGIMEFANGDVYEGFFKLDQFDGEGKMMYAAAPENSVAGAATGKPSPAAGQVYEGHFRHGQRHGQGVLKAADGTVLYKGLWREGEKKMRRKTM